MKILNIYLNFYTLYQAKKLEKKKKKKNFDP